MLVRLPILDEILSDASAALGADFHRYRNHSYRVANFHWELESGSKADLDIVAIAVAFHDLGLWTANTFDYLLPSEDLATAFLHNRGMQELTPLVVAMIDHHHQLSSVGPSHSPLVETFRRADWIDVTAGVRNFGVSPLHIKAVNHAFPSHGFHRRLVQFGLKHALHHPFHPLPMFKL